MRTTGLVQRCILCQLLALQVPDTPEEMEHLVHKRFRIYLVFLNSVYLILLRYRRASARAVLPLASCHRF
jgi:hypothetical protein